MPVGIENELKYVLRGHAAIEAAMSKLAPQEWLRSGYLSRESRLRLEEKNGIVSRVFTFKRRLATGRNIEIPQDLDEATFELLWPETQERLSKRRYTVREANVQWDVDFFVADSGHGDVYFALAEVEMPADMEAPERIHPLLAPHVAFAVPRDDNRFSSRLLANEDYARAIAKDLDAAA